MSRVPGASQNQIGGTNKAAHHHGLIGPLLHRLADGCDPLSGLEGPLCFVVEGCADAASPFSADPLPEEPAAP